jgi:hypothetical protein
VALLKSERAYDSLRSDLRFTALLKKMDFDREGPRTKS